MESAPSGNPLRVAAMWRTPIFQWLGGDHPMMTSLLAPRSGYEFLLDMPAPDAAARARRGGFGRIVGHLARRRSDGHG